MKKSTASLAILSLIMMVNAISYGIIIPLMYPFSAQFGIGPFGLSLLFASFSLAQLLATPIIGRLSDKYGRKPLLLLCLFGTSLSLALFASAQSVIVLFLARILDGITGGNNSVAQASIADSTEGKDRAKAFGLLGAAFGFGFLIGPALGGILSEQVSLSAPFWFASGLAFIGTVAGVIFLPESLPKNQREKSVGTVISPAMIWKAFKHPQTGVVLAISLLFMAALNAWIIGFQSFTNDVLMLSTQSIGLLFATFGLISIIMQAWGIRVLLNRIEHKKTILVWTMVLSLITMVTLYPITQFLPFFVLVSLFGIVSSPMTPILTALLSERTKPEDQGVILGINQSVVSLGQIIGPLIAGVVATASISLVFPVAGAILGLALLATRWLYVPAKQKIDL